MYILNAAPGHFDVPIKPLEAGIRLQRRHGKFPLIHMEPLETCSKCSSEQMPRCKQKNIPGTAISAHMSPIAEVFECVGEDSRKA